MRTRFPSFSPRRPSGRSPHAGLFPCLALVALMASTAPAFGTTTVVNFDNFSSGEQLNFQLQFSHGIKFPGSGGESVRALATSQARSAPNLAVSCLGCEFENPPFIAQFTSAQNTVTLWVRGIDGGANDATLRAFNQETGGSQVYSQTINFTGAAGWHSISVGSAVGTPVIRRIELTGGQTLFTPRVNFLQVDDLTYFRDVPAPPPPVDTEPPSLSILLPAFNSTITVPYLDVRVSASDNDNVAKVTGVIHGPAGPIVASMEFCGVGFSGACSNPITRTLQPSLGHSPANGSYLIVVTACDPSDNCTVRDRSFLLAIPEEEVQAPVTIHRGEINQGVADGLFNVRAPQSGDFVAAGGAAYRVAGRDTVLRFYPLGDGGAHTGFTALLRLQITYADGSVREVGSFPNTGSSSIDVVPDPGGAAREDEFLRMRIAPARTLNWVIPRERMQNATRLRMRLERPGTGPITAWHTANIRPAARLGVMEAQLIGQGVHPGTGATSAQIEASYDYVEATFPISELLRHNLPTKSIPLLIYDPITWIIWEELPTIYTLSVFRSYEPPSPFPLTGDPLYEILLGRLPFYSSNVGAAIDRTVVSMARADAAWAHELGHALWRPHSTTHHGEHRNPWDEGPWPHSHGLVGPTDFGVIVERTESPGPFDLGQWTLHVVDPCPAPDLASRRPACVLPDADDWWRSGAFATHDFMSYGAGGANLGRLGVYAPLRSWISVHNWNRIYDRIQTHGRVAPSSATRNQEKAPFVDALMIGALVREDDSVGSLPMVVRSVPQEELELASRSPGKFSLSILDGLGKPIVNREFEPTEVHDADEGMLFIEQLVPHTPAARRVVVAREGKVLLDKSGSNHTPAVELLAPVGGEVWKSGSHYVSWHASDPDGDTLISRVDYSADNGLSWQTISIVDGPPFEIEVDIADLPHSDRGRFRVVVSDGFHNAIAATPCPLAVGVNVPAACAASAPCVSGSETACLLGGRFEVKVDWQKADDTGTAKVMSFGGQRAETDQSVFMWFFQPENFEMGIKMVNACVPPYNSFWAFQSGLTNQGYTVRIRDTVTDAVRTYGNSLGSFPTTTADTAAFPCSNSGSSTLSVASRYVGPDTEALARRHGASLAQTLGTRARPTGAVAPRSGSCSPSAEVACLLGGRFEVKVDWQKADDTGTAKVMSFGGQRAETDQSVFMWFFQPENFEMGIKMVNACVPPYNSFWAFQSGLTNQGYTVTIRDTVSGAVRSYGNPLGSFPTTTADTAAFPCS